MLRILLFFLFVFSINSLAAQNQSAFFVNASSKKVVEGTDFSIEFVMNNIEGSNFEPPVFNNFDIISGPNRTSSYSNINGKVSQQLKLTYILRPTKVGRFTIGAAYCNFNGQKLATMPFEIEVQQRDKKSLEALGLPTDEDLFVRMEIKDDSAYLGEKIELVYKLYTSKSVRSYDINSEDQFEGFYLKHRAQRKTQSAQEEINGVLYSVQVLEKRILYPQQKGVFDIDPALITLGLPDPNQRNTGFFFNSNLKAFRTKTNSLTISVIDLPPNAPESFTGAVGKYQMQSTVDKKKISTDDAITVTITVSGNGDPKYLLPPSQNHLSSFEIYEPSIEEKGEREMFGDIQTIKVFEYLMVPLSTGKLNIDPKFTYFDTEKQDYVTLSPQNFDIEVSQGKNKSVTLRNDLKSSRTLSGILKNTDLKKNSSQVVWGPVHIGFISVFVLALGFIVIKKRRMDIEAGIDPLLKKRRKAKSVAEKRLKQAKIHLEANENKAFYNEISKSLLGYIADKLNVPQAEISKSNVVSKLKEEGLEENHLEILKNILNETEVALYAGRKGESMKETYEMTINLIDVIAQNVSI